MKRILILSISVVCSTLLFGQTAVDLHPTLPQTFPTATANQQTLVNLEWIEAQPSASLGIEVHSIGSGNWGDPGIWDCGCVPGIAHDVIVMPEDSVFIGAPVETGHLSVSEDAILAAAAVPFDVVLHGDFICEGSFQSGSSTVYFDGDMEQQISGDLNFHRISINGGANVSLLSPVEVTNAVYLSGNLVTNDQLTLKSSGVESSAFLAPVLGGTLEGTLTLERTIQSTANGWLTVSSPFESATFVEWDDDIVTSGFEGSQYPDYSFVNIQYYTEPAVGEEDTFAPIESVNDIIVPGQGYYVYETAGTRTFDVTGVPNIGSFDFPVSFTDSGDPLQDGLSVLGNPYPCNIEWGTDAWELNNMYNAIYVWDVSLNQFRTYASGYGVNDGTPLIRSGETFWVQAFAADPSLTVNESAKVDAAQDPAVNEGDQFLKLHLSGGGGMDEVIVAFNDNATHNFDPVMDARKFYSSGSLLNVSAYSQDEWDLAISQVPMDPNAFEVPIHITVQEAGDYQLELLNIPNIPERCIYIEDQLTGELYGLEQGLVVPFTSEAVEDEMRFVIRIDDMMEVNADAPLCFGENDGSIDAIGVGDGPWNYVWTDSDGNVLLEETASTSASQLTDLAPGTYHLSVDVGGHCATLNSSVAFEEPVEINVATSITPLDCDETNTAAVNVSASGGSGELTILWDNGFTEFERTDMEAGDYLVQITDENGCQEMVAIQIEAAPTVVAGFEASETVVNLDNGTATVSFTNTSENASSFLWNFGDGSLSSLEEDPEHTFTEEGAYIVSLHASNEDCDASVQQVIIVEEATGIYDIPMDETVNVTVQNGAVWIQFRHDDIRPYTIQAYNLLGQQLLSPFQGNYGSQKIRLDLLHQVPVMLIHLRDEANDSVQTFKILR